MTIPDKEDSASPGLTATLEGAAVRTETVDHGSTGSPASLQIAIPDKAVEAAARAMMFPTVTAGKPSEYWLNKAKTALTAAAPFMQQEKDYKSAFEAEHKAIQDIWKIVDPWATRDIDITVSTQNIVDQVRNLKAAGTFASGLDAAAKVIHLHGLAQDSDLGCQPYARARLMDACAAVTALAPPEQKERQE